MRLSLQQRFVDQSAMVFDASYIATVFRWSIKHMYHRNMPFNWCQINHKCWNTNKFQVDLTRSVIQFFYFYTTHVDFKSTSFQQNNYDKFLTTKYVSWLKMSHIYTINIITLTIKGRVFTVSFLNLYFSLWNILFNSYYYLI